MFKTDISNAVDYKRFVRYFYDPPPKNDDMSGMPIWCLGKEYSSGPPPKPVSTTDHDDVVEVESSTESTHAPSDATSSTSPEIKASAPLASSGSFDDASLVDSKNAPSLSNDPSDGGWPHDFLDDFESRAWMTYRSNFSPIAKSQDPNAAAAMSLSVRLRSFADRDGFTTDTGWGCMIRSGQSLLANALIMLRMGRDWRRQGAHLKEDSKVISLFADSPDAPFSIHKFVDHGATACGKHPGQWFGPSATASCIKNLTFSHPSSGLRVYVTENSQAVYEDRFRSIASNPIQPTLILLGLRLGPDRITPVYHEALKASLTYPQSIGIAGGRPSSSHYFIGCQGESFFYLDPHVTQGALPYHALPEDYSEEELGTVHTRRLRSLKIGDMDPSMLIGFLVKDEADWVDWKRRVGEVKGKPIVHVYEREPPLPGDKGERKEAVDEVETFDDDDEEDNLTEKGGDD